MLTLLVFVSADRYACVAQRVDRPWIVGRMRVSGPMLAASRLIDAGKIADRTNEMFSSLPSDGVSGLGANPHYLTKCEDDTHILLLSEPPRVLTAPRAVKTRHPRCKRSGDRLRVDWSTMSCQEINNRPTFFAQTHKRQQ
jgi:hypothetical protein